MNPLFSQLDKKTFEQFIQKDSTLVNKVDPISKETVLHKLALSMGKHDIELMEIVLKNRGDPNARNIVGNTPLAYVNSCEKAKLLMKYGADPFIHNFSGKCSSNKYSTQILSEGMRNRFKKLSPFK